MNVTGDLGSATSQGHCPNQGMMIYLSVSLLLQHLTRLYQSRKKQKFVGVDSSFTVWFRPTRLGIMVSCNGVLAGHVQLRELFGEVSRAVDEFCAKELSVLPDGDTGREDLLRALERFQRQHRHKHSPLGPIAANLPLTSPPTAISVPAAC